MPRQCTVCSHSRRDEIDEELVRGKTFRKLSERFGTSITALFRHKRSHLPATLVKSQRASESARGEDLLEKVHRLETDARRIAAEAEQSKDLRTAIMGIRELTRIIELLAKLRGELQAAPTTLNVQVVVPLLLEALEPYPDARQQVAARLIELEREAAASAG